MIESTSRATDSLDLLGDHYQCKSYSVTPLSRVKFSHLTAFSLSNSCTSATGNMQDLPNSPHF